MNEEPIGSMTPLTAVPSYKPFDIPEDPLARRTRMIVIVHRLPNFIEHDPHNSPTAYGYNLEHLLKAEFMKFYRDQPGFTEFKKVDNCGFFLLAEYQGANGLERTWMGKILTGYDSLDVEELK